ncbi:ABC transporter ATP-binding protein [Umezawaea beigongshangensis]|uniref:ABC transporter ATP-binding protein n=1 Tax=Umezawaea beigongshangensis TaxID=2780383 RepID=UPI0018F1246D|nr:ABC transporter ATP-binding protein [Umezawaea beigongshangensis]
MNPGDSTDAIRLTAVRKLHGRRDNRVVALEEVTTRFGRGAFTAIVGPSSSGKSTSSQCAAGLDQPTSGAVLLEEHELSDMTETELTELRRDRIGFVLQAFNLLPVLTVRQNVTLPLRLAGRKPDRDRVARILDQIDLAQQSNHPPAELSGGQQQRVTIARALLSDPAVIFADEPTGALDTRAARDVLSLLRHSSRAAGQTIVMVTHDPVAASHADHVLFLADGRLTGELHSPTAESVADRMPRLGAFADEGPRPQPVANRGGQR